VKEIRKFDAVIPEVTIRPVILNIILKINHQLLERELSCCLKRKRNQRATGCFRRYFPLFWFGCHMSLNFVPKGYTFDAFF
jgi:hypothetical protein